MKKKQYKQVLDDLRKERKSLEERNAQLHVLLQRTVQEALVGNHGLAADNHISGVLLDDIRRTIDWNYAWTRTMGSATIPLMESIFGRHTT